MSALLRAPSNLVHFKGIIVLNLHIRTRYIEPVIYRNNTRLNFGFSRSWIVFILLKLGPFSCYESDRGPTSPKQAFYFATTTRMREKRAMILDFGTGTQTHSFHNL